MGYELVAYQVALELARELRPVVETLNRHDRNLADQLKRAATSVVLNVAEGEGLSGKRRTNHFRIALGSAREANACLDLSHAWGYTQPDQKVQALFKRTRALLAGLTKANR